MSLDLLVKYKPKIQLLVVLFSLVLSGQNPPTSKIGLAIGSAYNTQVKQSNQFFPVSYHYYNRFSPYVGVVFRDSISRLLSLKTSVYYVQRGVRYHYKYETPFYSLHADQKFTCHYVSFPIKLLFNIKRFFVGVGLEGSILIKGHYDFMVEEKDANGYYIKSVLNKWYGTNDNIFQTR